MVAARAFDPIATEAIAAFDKVIGLDLTEAAVDGSLQEAPTGGEGTGKNPPDQAKLGWKLSILTEKKGPIGWTITGANRNGCVLLGATLGSALEAPARDAVGRVAQNDHPCPVDGAATAGSGPAGEGHRYTSPDSIRRG